MKTLKGRNVSSNNKQWLVYELESTFDYYCIVREGSLHKVLCDGILFTNKDFDKCFNAVQLDIAKKTIEHKLQDAYGFANEAMKEHEAVDDYMRRFINCDDLTGLDVDIIYLMQDELSEKYNLNKKFIDLVASVLMHENDNYSGSAFYDLITILESASDNLN